MKSVISGWDYMWNLIYICVCIYIYIFRYISISILYIYHLSIYLSIIFYLSIYSPYPRICLLIFRKRGREKEREISMWKCERQTSIGCLPYMSQLEIKPATQVCALIENQNHNCLVYRTTIWHGQLLYFLHFLRYWLSTQFFLASLSHTC